MKKLQLRTAMNSKNMAKALSALLSMSVMACAGVASAQVTTKGLPPAANTSQAYLDASVARDSGINQPLDLLNDFYPSIEVVISDHDNVRRRSDIEEDDLKIAVLPSLAYRTNFGRHQFYAAYSGVFTFHDELDDEDSESNNLNAKLGLDLARRWDLDLFAGVGTSYEERGISGTRSFGQFVPGGIDDNGPDETEYGRYGADLVYGRKVGPLVAVLGFDRYSSTYKNNLQGDNNSTGGRDRDQDSIHFDISYEIGAKTAIFGRIQETEIDYDRSLNSLDSEQTDFLIGLRWKPTNAFSGTVGIGNSDRDFDDPSREGYDSSNYYANVDYSFNPFSVIQLSASRIVEEPGDAESDFYESELFGIGWDHSINPQLVFNAYAKWIDDDYNTGREDQFFDWGVGLDYIWRSWLTAGLFYGEIERDSNDNSIDYEDAYFGIRLRSDLRSLLKGRGKVVEPDSFEYPRGTN